jgi:hypothetical protein
VRGYRGARRCRGRCEEAVKVEDALQGASKLFSADEVGTSGFDRGVAGLNGDGVDHGPQERGAEKALAHGGAAGVHGAEESRVGTRVVEDGVDQFKIAGGDLIDIEMFGAAVETERVDMASVVVLGAANVMDDGAGGDGRCGMAGETEAFEGAAPELTFKERDGAVSREHPVVDGSPRADLVEERI